MRPMKSGAEDRQSERRRSAVRLRNGTSLPLDVITCFTSRSSKGLTPESTVASTVETSFREIANGGLLDLVRDDYGNLTFAFYQEGSFTLHHTFKDVDVTLGPPVIHRSLSDAVNVPKTIGEIHTARELLHQIDEVFRTYVDFDASDRKLLGHFALYTWVSDLLLVAPYLWVVGPYCCGKTTLLRLLGAICRRSVLVGDISMAALYALSTAMHPTFLIDEFEPSKDSKSRDLQRLLRVGSTNGQKILRASRAYNLFGPKVIASRQGPSDAALESRGFHIVARPASRSVAALTPKVLAEIEMEFQPKLLAFRLHNYGRLSRVDTSSAASSCSTARVQDMLRALTLPVIGDQELEENLLAAVMPHDKEATILRHGEPEWAVMTALLGRIHELGPVSNSFTVKQLTAEVNYLLVESGESYRLTPRKVGSILRSLGVQTQKLGSLGRGVKKSRALVRKVHEIAKLFGLCTADLFLPDLIGVPGSCADCEQAGINIDNDGKKLPYSEIRLFPESPCERCARGEPCEHTESS